VGPSPQTSTASENHGVGASMDGMWLYTEGTDSRSTYGNHDVLNVINARTLKVDKIINSRVHHARAYHDAALNKDLVIIDAWNNEFYIMDPADNHKIVKAMAPADLAGTGYTAFVNYAGTHLFIAARGGSFPGTDLGVFVVDLKTMKVVSRINIGDTGPTWVTFSANGKYAYVSGDHASMIAQIDISDANVGNWKMVGRSTAGVIGDYGVSLNWQDTIIFPTGKSEGASNKGEDTAIIVTSKFGNPAALSQGSELAPVYLNGCLRPDHSVVHPDPVVNELWFNCNSTMEMAVINMGNPLLSTDPFAWQSVKVVKANITATNPNGNVANANQGSSHGGAFAKYTVTNGVWKGELLSDTNGMHNSAIPLYKAAAAAAGN
jgi:hypothetical protein